MPVYSQDTIAAIATPLGTGGVGILRISGEKALALSQKLFRPRGRALDYKPGRMYFGDFLAADSRQLDSGYFVWFKKPRSFTGENVVEFHCHGGVILMQRLLRELFALGIRPAEPGEFTKRAFLNGKIDLVQAEAISDLICAQSSRAADIARTHYQGKLSERIEIIRSKLAEIIAWLEAEIDYPDTEIDFHGRENAVGILREQIAAIRRLHSTYEEGRIYREGIVTVILGKPNVGKSSLLNLLAGEERAIVTDIPGTTRDVVEVPVNIRGIPLRLADTAGIRQTLDKVERIGVDRAHALAAKADLVLLVLDSSRPLEDEDRQLLAGIDKGRTIAVLNKADLPAQFSAEDLRVPGITSIKVSVLKEQGLEELKDYIETMFVSGKFQPDAALITNSRHYQGLVQAEAGLTRVAAGWSTLPMDLLALDLRESWQVLGEITGAVWHENLLDTIFSSFCLGK
jgi:tRNA modification GTPase